MKIALIAMSGIRVQDAELLEMGLTLPGFVERSRTIASLPSLGLLTLAGLTPAEYDVDYIEVADLKQLSQLPTDYDLVAISTFSAQAPESYELAAHYRAAGIPVVMGGLHATTMPDEVNGHRASVSVGEGEVTWPNILADARRGKLQPIYTSRGREFDLAHAPMPRFDLLDIDRYNRITVQTSRGCPWKCSFCASSILLTGKYKQKPAEKVLAEIDSIRELWRRPFIELADDNSFVNTGYWKSLLPELAKRRIKWFTETDISVADDEQVLALMRKAGCAEVLIGLESPIDAGMGGIELKRNWKQQQVPRYRAAVERIQRHGIRVNACFVLGLDGQTPAVFDEVYRFAEQVAPFDVQITYATPFPGTPMYARMKRQGRLTHDGDWARCTLFDINYAPDPMTAEQLRDGFVDLTQRLYCDAFTKYRRDRFKQYARGLVAA